MTTTEATGRLAKFLWVRMGVAEAEAYEGRTEEALRDGKAALRLRGFARRLFLPLRCATSTVSSWFSATAATRPLAVLREMLSLPMFPHTPNEIRCDPVRGRG